MKKYLFFTLAMAIYTGAFAQVNHNYTFAIGDTNGVTLTWDAFSDDLEILGCYVYKKVKHDHTVELISPEMVISDDSAYIFTDYGVFDPIYPPIYDIHIVTSDSTYVTNNIYAFNKINFEPEDDFYLRMEVQAWNNEQCCYQVTAFIDGIFVGQSGYDTLYVYYFILPRQQTEYGNTWFIFEDNNWDIGTYATLTLSLSYIQSLANMVNNVEMNRGKWAISIFPNPATTQTWLQLPENKPLTAMQIELYSPTGRLLYKAQPTSQFHKIEVAHLPKGLYLVRIRDGERWYAEKLVVR
jgi:hypothetical protein